MTLVKLGAKLAFVCMFIFSACALQAGNFAVSEAFTSGSVQAYGLAGIPWEASYSHDEERGRAWMDALHHAYEDALSLPLMEGLSVKNAMQTNKGLRERLGNILMLAPKTFYQPDITGLIRCKVELPLNGKNSIKTALYLAALRPVQQEPLAFLASWTARIAVDEKAPAPAFKRIIIDMRKYHYIPSLFPRFFTEKGVLIFQEAMTAEPYRFTKPAVRFCESITDAREDFEDNETLTIAASLDPLATCDITVEETDLDVFLRFCREIVRNPSAERDIMIVFDSKNAQPLGKLPQPKAAEKKEDKK